MMKTALRMYYFHLWWCPPRPKVTYETCVRSSPTSSHFTLSSIHTVATTTEHYDTYLIHFVSSQGTDVSRTRRGDNCLLWRMMSPREPGGKQKTPQTVVAGSSSGFDITRQSPLLAASWQCEIWTWTRREAKTTEEKLLVYKSHWLL